MYYFACILEKIDSKGTWGSKVEFIIDLIWLGYLRSISRSQVMQNPDDLESQGGHNSS